MRITAVAQWTTALIVKRHITVKQILRDHLKSRMKYFQDMELSVVWCDDKELEQLILVFSSNQICHKENVAKTERLGKQISSADLKTFLQSS